MNIFITVSLIVIYFTIGYFSSRFVAREQVKNGDYFPLDIGYTVFMWPIMLLIQLVTSYGESLINEEIERRMKE